MIIDQGYMDKLKSVKVRISVTGVAKWYDYEYSCLKSFWYALNFKHHNLFDPKSGFSQWLLMYAWLCR